MIKLIIFDLDGVLVEAKTIHFDALNDVSLVYIRPFNDTKGYMLCVDHSETTSLNKTIIGAILQNTVVINTGAEMLA